MVIVVVAIILSIILASSIPLIQYIIANRKTKESYTQKYMFSDELVNFDIEGKELDEHTDRFSLANRGWIRCPNGTIMSEKNFQAKKEQEYKIELP